VRSRGSCCLLKEGWEEQGQLFFSREEVGANISTAFLRCGSAVQSDESDAHLKFTADAKVGT
jgi:hypothetical protein